MEFDKKLTQKETILHQNVLKLVKEKRKISEQIKVDSTKGTAENSDKKQMKRSRDNRSNS